MKLPFNFDRGIEKTVSLFDVVLQFKRLNLNILFVLRCTLVRVVTCEHRQSIKKKKTNEFFHCLSLLALRNKANLDSSMESPGRPKAYLRT